MSQILLACGSLLGGWAGMAALCFRSSTQRHRMGLPALSSLHRSCLLAAAILMLSISLGAAIASNGSSFGIVTWLCQTGILGVVLTFWLPYSMPIVARSAGISGIGAVLLMFAAR